MSELAVIREVEADTLRHEIRRLWTLIDGLREAGVELAREKADLEQFMAAYARIMRSTSAAEFDAAHEDFHAALRLPAVKAALSKAAAMSGEDSSPTEGKAASSGG